MWCDVAVAGHAWTPHTLGVCLAAAFTFTSDGWLRVVACSGFWWFTVWEVWISRSGMVELNWWTGESLIWSIGGDVVRCRWSSQTLTRRHNLNLKTIWIEKSNMFWQRIEIVAKEQPTLQSIFGLLNKKKSKIKRSHCSTVTGKESETKS